MLFVSSVHRHRRRQLLHLLLHRLLRRLLRLLRRLPLRRAWRLGQGLGVRPRLLAGLLR